MSSLIVNKTTAWIFVGLMIFYNLLGLLSPYAWITLFNLVIFLVLIDELTQ